MLFPDAAKHPPRILRLRQEEQGLDFLARETTRAGPRALAAVPAVSELLADTLDENPDADPPDEALAWRGRKAPEVLQHPRFAWPFGRMPARRGG